MTRYVTTEGVTWTDVQIPHPTPSTPVMEDRYRIYTLCLCDGCGGRGKAASVEPGNQNIEVRCKECRGEGRRLTLVATAADPESVGVALVTLAAEGEFESCPIGLMDRPEGQTGKWLILPYGPSARNISDAGRVLASARKK